MPTIHSTLSLSTSHTMSDSRDASSKVLETVLRNLQRLDLTVAISNISPANAKTGGAGDIHRALLRKSDGSVIRVALKRVRVSLKSDATFAKASQLKTARSSIADHFFAVFRQRTICLGEA